MIPDTTIMFKQYDVPRNFDNHEIYLRHLLLQDDLPKLKDRRHLFSMCEEVGR
jgi:hypothetical protein